MDHPAVERFVTALHRAGMTESANGVRVLDDEVRTATGRRRHGGQGDPAFVKAHTGQSIGGVAPAGHPKPVRTLVDTHLARYEVVWAAAGHPRSVFPTTFDSLLTLTGGTAADVAELEDEQVS